ncbi:MULTISPECIES: carboxylesterase/lipase family protein [unclassified Novosphingobium]|mgnify:CR=1 FL=1|uniref:carboxylesterase/lipase family protein n=1 Tax=unclassified Novosphingobium TaxID=2644732 RepID=UPI00086F1240|nr:MULTISPECIES: carboxylesterase family protein [unclassified Novosphingobium]MBN9145359.1 carboxylesterase family protein [Novosphingobium sp.]MDR6709902.1 para-nitrobenzyl esterase [Novosphingobium sp. 1748]ODU83172.1 MAG: carboxylesterase [Novosphingobium sp. SCN 63-17]OJX88087.1 MAG: carboxylesterase [Novosphingobium sp. 63-713]
MKHRALAALAALMAFPIAAQAQPRAVVEQGALVGQTQDGVTSFKGIPFAAPPVGALRWRAPQPAGPWQGDRDAANFGHDCMQVYQPNPLPPGSEHSEDCLYLNIWRLAGEARKLPVLVWIYGGGFVNGSASRWIYAGDRLARRGVMLVSFNYRLGRFGTFAHPALTRADEDKGQLGNYGYMDQIAAMRWIRRNIAAFGGDPANITIMGESAGGMSVHNLLTSPQSQGLFARAIIASGGDGHFIGDPTLAGAEAIGKAFGEEQGIGAQDADALARLRAVPADKVLGGIKMSAVMGPGPRKFSSPFPDGRVTVDPLAAYRAGAFNRVPVMVGATSGDMGGREGMMVKGAREMADLFAAKGLPTYYYRFSYVADAAPTPKSDGAIHADDLPYYFDTVDVKYGDRTRPADAAMGHIIADYVVNFAKTGVPFAPGQAPWPAYRAKTRVMMDFSAAGRATPGRDPWADGAAVAEKSGPRRLFNDDGSPMR